MCFQHKNSQTMRIRRFAMASCLQLVYNKSGTSLPVAAMQLWKGARKLESICKEEKTVTFEELHRTARIKTLKIGLLGGTFDPIHRGHIEMAQIAIEEYGLDWVWFLVSHVPPHKTNISDAELRFQMTDVACRKYPKMEVSRQELDRDGSTYTIDTLETLIPLLPPTTELYYIIGTDTLYELKTWKRYRDVLSKTSFILIPRHGYDETKTFSYLMTISTQERFRVSMANRSAPDISSTLVRQRIMQQLPVDDYIEPEVMDIIQQNQLYGQEHEGLSFDAVREQIRHHLSPARYQHTLRVIEAAERLAYIHKESVPKARWAALLHDAAKEEAKQPLPYLTAQYGFQASPSQLLCPALIHAPLGALLAKTVYGMTDPDVLSAIAKHTTGAVDMSPLDMIIYLADIIEKDRVFPGVEELRQLVESDLERATFEALNHSIAHVTSQGQYLDKESVAARNAFWKRLHNRKSALSTENIL